MDLRFKEQVSELPKNFSEYLFVKTDGKNNFEKIYVKDIMYIEALKNYVAIHFTEKQIITNNTLKNIADFLPKSDFVNTPRSFVVSLRHSTKTDSLCAYIKDKNIPIGDTYKKKLFELFRIKNCDKVLECLMFNTMFLLFWINIFLESFTFYF